MLSRCRSALMWLLLFALPLHGFAAAAMIHCGPNHHRMLAASAAAAAEPHEHAHQHATSGHHGHEAGALPAGAGDLDEMSKFKCSACAACCMGVAMPTAAIFVASLPPAAPTPVLVSAPPVDFLSDGLDRPPRPLLA